MRSFVALAEELHFTRAAERLFVSQPALSQQIRVLEDDLGVKLFRRSSKDVTLTDAGLLLLPGARALLRDADRLVESVRALGSTPTSPLRVGLPAFGDIALVNESLAAFHRERPHPGFEVRELPASTPALIKALLDDVIDVGFGIAPVVHDEVVSEVVYSEPHDLVLPEEHILSGEAVVSLGQLAQETFILFPRELNPLYFDHMLASIRREGHEPKLRWGALLGQTREQMVRMGQGVTLKLASAPLELPGLVKRPIRGLPDFQLAVAWRQGAGSTAAALFLNLVRALRTSQVAGTS